MNMRLLLALLLALIPLAGCLAPGEPGTNQTATTGPAEGNTTAEVPGPCEPFYYVGCDDSPDAEYMKDTYGLWQISNATRLTTSIYFEGGLVVWNDGGSWVGPLRYTAYDIDEQRHYRVPRDDAFRSYGYIPKDGEVLRGEAPRLEDHQPDKQNMSLIRWTPSTNTSLVRDVPVEGFPIDFDGEWTLLRLFEEKPDEQEPGLAGLHWNGTYRELWPVKPLDGSSLGGPLVGKELTEGYAYISFYYGGPNGWSSIVEYDLEAGTQREVINQTGGGPWFSLHAQDGYLVVEMEQDGIFSNWVWRAGGDAWQQTEAGIDPTVDNGIMMYAIRTDDEHDMYGDRVYQLKAYDLETGQSWVVLQEDGFHIGKWFGDGEHYVVLISPGDDGPLQVMEGPQYFWGHFPGPPE